MSRLRLGEVVAGAGGLALLGLLFLDWFALESTLQFALEKVARADVHTTGWSTLGWFLDVLLVVAMLGAAALVFSTVSARSVARTVSAAVLTTSIGTIATLVLVLRVILEPGLGVSAPNEFVDVKTTAWLGVACAAAIPLGAFIALKDERTEAPESAYTPPPPRPTPPVVAP